MEINLSKPVEKTKVVPDALKGKGNFLEFWLLLIIAGLFAWFVVIPKAQQLSKVKAEASQLTEESKNISEQQAKLKSFIGQLDTNAKNLAILDESLPLHPRTTWLYLLIENLAGSSGITLSDLSITNEKDGVVAADSVLIDKPFSVQRVVRKSIINIHITGSLGQFVGFLGKLESSGRLVNIRSLEMQSSSDNLLDFSLTGEAYYFAP